MVEGDFSSPESFMQMAISQANEISDIERENKIRVASGLKPKMLPAEKFERSVRNVGSTGSCQTVSSSDALRMYEDRKAKMHLARILEVDGGSVDAEEAKDEKAEAVAAKKIAESIRRVSDMKGGRVDHAGIWDGSENLEHGDPTSISDFRQRKQTHESDARAIERNDADDVQDQQRKRQRRRSVNVSEDAFNDFRDDLYLRLKESFKALEDTLSDLQGRVEEIVVVSVKGVEQQSSVESAGKDDFEELLNKKTPVVFDVNGTKMAFDAICVFHASPCITVVSKAGSAFIMPRPGARLSLNYEMDGVKYTNDPVTFLGTRFELPMFGLSFVGFIRDVEAGKMDADMESGGVT